MNTSSICIAAESVSLKKRVFLGKTKSGYYLWTRNEDYILKFNTVSEACDFWDDLQYKLPEEMLAEAYEGSISFGSIGFVPEVKVNKDKNMTVKYVVSGEDANGSWVYLVKSTVKDWDPSIKNARIFRTPSDARRCYKKWKSENGINNLNRNTIAIRKVMFKTREYLEGESDV